MKNKRYSKVKRMVSLLLSVLCIVPVVQMGASAEEIQDSEAIEMQDTENYREDIITLRGESGEEIVIITRMNSEVSMTKVYVDGVLMQKSTLNVDSLEGYGEAVVSEDEIEELGSDNEETFEDGLNEVTYGIVYLDENQVEEGEVSTDYDRFQDLGADEFLADEIGEEIGDDMIEQVDLAKKESINKNPPLTRATIDSVYQTLPANNANMKASGNNDGYYHVGSLSHMGNTGILSRKYTESSQGLQKRFQIKKETAISILTDLIKLSNPNWVTIVLTVISISDKLKTNYDESPEVYVSRFDYNYRTRVKEAGNNIYFNSYDRVDYWRAHNPRNSSEAYEEKQHFGGTGGNNVQRCVQGVENYYTYHFYDIIDHWGKNSIKYVKDKGFMAGTSDYAFSPSTNASRAMFVTTIYGLVGRPAGAPSSGFSDVPKGSYYEKAVNWAKQEGITSGVGNNMFGSNNSVSRQDLILMLYKTAKIQRKSTTATGNLGSFNDGGSVASYATDAMKWAVGKKIITGDNGYIKPSNYCNRVELASIIEKYDKLK